MIELHPYAQQVLDVVIPIIATGLGGLLLVAFTRLNAWLRTKVDSTAFDHASELLDKIVVDAVAEAEQTIVREFKSAREDGVLTRAEAEHILREVIAVVKQQLGSRLPEIAKQLGISTQMIESLIETRIEAAIARMRTETKTTVTETVTTSTDPANAPTVEIGRPDLPPVPRSLSPDGPAKPSG